MSGRRLAPIWRYFNRDATNSRNIKATCKACKVEVQGIVKRLEKHVETCESVSNQSTTEPSLKRKMDDDNVENDTLPSAKKLKNDCIDKVVVRTNDEQINAFNLQMTRAIIATNSSFTLADNSEFRKFYNMLRPGIRLAERHKVAGPLLDTVYAEELQKARNKFSGDVVTLAIDGWSNITNDPVIGVSITANNSTFLVDTIDTSGNPHTTEYMSKIAIDAIQKAEDTFNVKVGHIVTDGASNMVAMRQTITEAREQDIITYHCQPHLLNLLAKDIDKEQAATVNKVITVLKYFRNKHAAQSKLHEVNLTKPPLPAETRWNTLRDSLLYYCNNWPTLVQVISDLQPSNGTERKFLENVQIRRAACDLLAIFEAITVALNRLQADSATIAEAIEVWLNLLDTIRTLENPSVTDMTTKRSQQALKEPSFLAANLLDHRYLGKRLTAPQIIQATKFIKEIDCAAERAVTILIAGTAPYDTTLLSKDVDPTIWWTAGRRLGFDESLCQIALKLVSAVANSAGLERQFSTLKFTYGSLRTSLGIEKAGKLAFCYRSLNQ